MDAKHGEACEFTVVGVGIYFTWASFFNFTKNEMSFKEIEGFRSEKNEIALELRDMSKAERAGGIFRSRPVTLSSS